MLNIFLCLLIPFLILVLAEYLWRKKILRGELQRKLIHITTGCFVASWPWLISWRSIWIIGLAMAIVVALNRVVTVLHFSDRINRDSYGDLFFALTIFFSALFITNKTYFAIAILIMSLSDGLAALVGKKYGKSNSYKIFDQTKSIAGSATFWAVSLIILAIGLSGQHLKPHEYWLVVILLPPALTLIENTVILGLDNLAVPLIALLALSSLN
ncbi:MAG TPA: hypothetical protein VFT49_04255 [Candidatus Saccharimonadales bacterium]|nr:hypothetical protein [Candidatus Saccharimonadales bacterium]